MGARSGNATKIIESIRAGKVTPEALCKATGLDRINLSSTLGYMRRQGQISYEKISATQIDWSTMRVAGAAQPKPARASTKVPKANPAEQTCAPGGDRLVVDASSLKRLQTYAQSLADEVTAILGSPSLATALMGLATQLGAPAAAPVAAKPAKREPKPKATRKPRKMVEKTDPVPESAKQEEPAPKSEPVAKTEATSAERLVLFRAIDRKGRQLAVFGDLAAAETYFKRFPGTHRIIRAADGAAVKER